MHCTVKKGTSTIHDQNHSKNSNGSFNIEISNLEPADNYSVLLYGKNSSGDIIGRGYRSAISVTAGDVTNVSMSWNDVRPDLSLPLDGSTTTDNTPSFDWSSVSGASYYELEVDNSSSFSSPAIDQSSLTGSGYTATSSLSDGTWYWRVRAKDSQGNWGGWSSTWSFTIDTQGPDAPTLTSPTNGSTSSDNTPAFDWTDVSGASYYELEVDNSSSFSSPAIDQSSLTSSGYTATSSLSDDTYYWRVRAKDSQGNWGGWSSTWSFTIDTQGPDAPTLTSPANGSTSSDNTPAFDWTDVSGASYYELEVDNSNTFTSPSIDQSSLTSSGYTATSSLADDTYYWRVRAKDSQGNWGGWSSTWSFTIDTQNEINIEWITVQSGTFQMGSNDGDSDEQPIHTVALSSFQISKYEITNSQYCEFLNDYGVSSDGSYSGTEYIDMDDPYCQINYIGGQFVLESGKENYPVIEVTWYGADAFCEWAGGRLPTEAEWEYAARGGNQSNGYTYSGSNNVDDVAWYWDNSTNTDNQMYEGKGTHTVGTKQSNELGIYDMSGNVWEWCHDWYDSYSSSSQNDPQGPSSGTYRVLRGGGWYSYEGNCRCTNRNYNVPAGSYSYYGFRSARTL